MKVSCLPCSIFAPIISDEITLEQWVASAPEMNLDGVDFSMMFLKQHTSTYISKVKAMLDKYATPVVMCTTYPDFTHPCKLQRERELEYFKNDIGVCAELGIKYIRVLAGQNHPGIGRQEGINRAVEGIRKAADYADKNGIGILYENHSKPGAWDYCDFSFPLDIFDEVMEGISDTSVRLNYDLGNTDAAGGDTVAYLKKYIDKIETIHVTDMAEHGKMSSVLIGTGQTRITECFRALKDAGWDKWLCIEETSGNGFEGIKQAVANTRKLWEEA